MLHNKALHRLSTTSIHQDEGSLPAHIIFLTRLKSVNNRTYLHIVHQMTALQESKLEKYCHSFIQIQKQNLTKLLSAYMGILYIFSHNCCQILFLRGFEVCFSRDPLKLHVNIPFNSQLNLRNIVKQKNYMVVMSLTFEKCCIIHVSAKMMFSLFKVYVCITQKFVIYLYETCFSSLHMNVFLVGTHFLHSSTSC